MLGDRSLDRHWPVHPIDAASRRSDWTAWPTAASTSAAGPVCSAVDPSPRASRRPDADTTASRRSRVADHSSRRPPEGGAGRARAAAMSRSSRAVSTLRAVAAPGASAPAAESVRRVVRSPTRTVSAGSARELHPSWGALRPRWDGGPSPSNATDPITAAATASSTAMERNLRLVKGGTELLATGGGGGGGGKNRRSWNLAPRRWGSVSSGSRRGGRPHSPVGSGVLAGSCRREPGTRVPEGWISGRGARRSTLCVPPCDDCDALQPRPDAAPGGQQ